MTITNSINSNTTTPLKLFQGGTQANLTASNGGIFYSTATAGAILSGTATAGQILRSGSNAAPTWSTAVYPATSGANGNVLTSDGTNWISSAAAGVTLLTTKGDLFGFSTVNARVPVGSTNGQILQVDSVAATGLSYSTPTYPAASGTAGQTLRSNGTNNVYSTATFADTYTASNLLYSNGANTVTGLATANNGVLVTSGTGVPSISSTLPSGMSATNMSLTTPTLGVADATSVNFGGGALANYVPKTSFTPTFTFSTPGDLTVSYAIQDGRYVRIGDVVYFYYLVRFTPTYTTASANARFGGFPISIDTAFSFQSNASTSQGTATWPTGVTQIFFIPSTTSTFVLAGVGSATAQTNFTVTQFPTGVQQTVSATGFYFV